MPFNFGDYVPKIFGGGKQNNSEARSATRNPQNESEPAKLKNVEAEVEEIAVTNHKRPRNEGITGIRASKRRDTRSDFERRLTGDYKTPVDAQPISIVPPTKNESPASTTQAKMKAKQFGGTFRSMNTLSDSPHSRQANGDPRNRPAKQLPAPQLPIQSSRGINVPPASSLRGDEFPDERHVGRKKQKLPNGTAKMTIETQPIDLTQEGSQPTDPFGDPVEYKGRKVSTSGSSGSGTHHPPFVSNELASLNSMTSMGSTKKPRKSKDGQMQGCSQTSSRNTPAEQIHQAATAKQLANGPPVVNLDDDSQNSDVIQIRRSQSQAKQRQPLHHSVNFGNGQSPRKDCPGGDIGGVQASGDILQGAMQRRSNAEQAVQLQQSNAQQKLQPQQQLPRRKIEQANPDGSFFSYVKLPAQARPSSPRLNDKFTRIDEPTTKTKATSRMKTASDIKAKRVSPISDDELHGETTIRSQASRSVSPQKPAVVVVNGVKHASVPSHRGVSPSNMRPTQFSAQHSAQKQRSKSKPQQRPHKVDGDSGRIPIRCIFCLSCVKEAGDEEKLELLWDHDSDGFLVEFDGDALTVPHANQLVCIGAGEASNWYDASSRDSTIVQIKGPRTANSSTSIIIQFEDTQGLHDCFAHLQAATNDNLNHFSLPSEKMKNIAVNQSKEILQEYKKVCRHGGARAETEAPARNTSKHADAELVAMQNRKSAPITGRAPEDDQIIYEPVGEPEQRLSSRRRVQGGALLKDEQSNTRTRGTKASGTASKYFPPEPRRSSRQPKPVLYKSPTPPPPKRWTVENQPDRWSCSVVYPPEGKRRVTVDFPDLERLDEGEFLNDNVISFALRRIEEQMSREHKESVHFFNTFFYSALTTKNGKKTLNYDAVKRWTKDKDLFNYPYTVVPINIDLHWFVAIICNLNNLSRKAAALEVDDGDETAENEAVSHMNEELRTAATDEKPHADNTKEMSQLSLSDEESKSKKAGKGNFTDVSMSTPTVEARAAPASRPSTASKKSKRKLSYRPVQYDPETPSIITLDSFGSSHTTEIRFLKEYVQAEAETKRGMEVDTKDLQGMTAKGVPEQTNFCDCGVYLVGYIEQFAQDPRKFVTKVLTKQLDKEADFATFDPSSKRAEIRDQLLALQKDQEVERKSKKSTKKTADKMGEDAAKAQPASTSANVQAPKQTTPDSAPPQLERPASAAASAASAPDESVTPAYKKEQAHPDSESQELEVAIPRAFNDLDHGEEQVTKQSPADEVEEMLDTADDGDPNANHSPRPLVDGLLAQIYEDGPLPAQNDVDGSPSDDRPEQQSTRQLDTSNQSAVRETAGKSMECVQLDGTDERGMEVPDSQEESSYAPRYKWTGKRTTFA